MTVSATNRLRNSPPSVGPDHHQPTPAKGSESHAVGPVREPGPDETSPSAAHHSLTAKYNKTTAGVLGSGPPPAVDASASPAQGTRHQPVVVGTQVVAGAKPPPGETFRAFAEAGKYAEAARHMNGLSMNDMLVYCDRLSPGARAGLEKAVPTITGIDATRTQFALDVVNHRQLPWLATGIPSDQVSDAQTFLRSRDWMDRAHAEVGTVEKKGDELRYPKDHPEENKRGRPVDASLPQSEPRIVEYHMAGGLGRAPDEEPWCSSYVNFVMKGAGETGSGRPSAQSWLTWGKEIDHPAVGSIAVVKGSRGDGADAKGHVGIVAGVAPDGRPVLLGGNQDDEVNYSIEDRPLYSFRVPGDYSPPAADYQLPVLEGAREKKSDR